MENPIIVPFDLNTARKIKSGEIEGSVLIDNIEIEFVYELKDCAGPYNLLFVKKDGYGISAIYANTEGCTIGGITPIYKRRLWSEEVKVVNDKMTNMKTRTYEGVQHGDWVRCVLCGAQMLLPCGADKCPECSSKDTLMWVDENRQEMDAKHLDCLVPIRKLELQEYLSPEILKMEHI